MIRHGLPATGRAAPPWARNRAPRRTPRLRVALARIRRTSVSTCISATPSCRSCCSAAPRALCRYRGDADLASTASRCTSADAPAMTTHEHHCDAPGRRAVLPQRHSSARNRRSRALLTRYRPRRGACQDALDVVSVPTTDLDLHCDSVAPQAIADEPIIGCKRARACDSARLRTRAHAATPRRRGMVRADRWLLVSCSAALTRTGCGGARAQHAPVDQPLGELARRLVVDDGQGQQVLLPDRQDLAVVVPPLRLNRLT